jgi:hypothetical protein
MQKNEDAYVGGNAQRRCICAIRASIFSSYSIIHSAFRNWLCVQKNILSCFLRASAVSFYSSVLVMTLLGLSYCKKLFYIAPWVTHNNGVWPRESIHLCMFSPPFIYRRVVFRQECLINIDCNLQVTWYRFTFLL